MMGFLVCVQVFEKLGNQGRLSDTRIALDAHVPFGVVAYKIQQLLPFPDAPFEGFCQLLNTLLEFIVARLLPFLQREVFMELPVEILFPIVLA